MNKLSSTCCRRRRSGCLFYPSTFEPMATLSRSAKRVRSLPRQPRGEGVRGVRLLKQGEWTIEGFRWQTPLLAKLPPNMALESLKVELRLNEGAPATTNKETGDSPYGVHFTAKGKYYVSN